MTPDGFSSDDLILVSGASSGIGRATAVALVQAGARVVGVARNQAALDSLAAELGDHFVYSLADLSGDVEQCGNLVADIVAKHGKISAFVHAAGSVTPQPLAVLDAGDVQAEFNTNLLSAVFLTKAVTAKKNRQENLSILYISSIAARIGKPGALTYAMTKAGLNSLTVSLARELIDKKVRINALMPGSCDTPMAEAFGACMPYNYRESVEAKNIHHTMMLPQSVAEMVVFLLSPKARWIHGQCLTMDGGESLA